MKKSQPKRPLKKIQRKARRTTALMLCAALVLSLVTYIMPARAEGFSGKYEDLYIREADENTMDSYVYAGLGGYVYDTSAIENLGNGVTAIQVTGKNLWLVNNYGTRFAGEVWADKSVFAQYQSVKGEILSSGMPGTGDESRPLASTSVYRC